MSPRTTRSSTGRVLAAIGLMLAAGEAAAQSASCGELGGQLGERKAIADKLNAAGNKQIDAKVACSAFTQLVANGTKLLKWSETNKDWCQVPDSFLEGIKADHSKAISIRAKACGVAAKQSEMERQAKSGGGSGAGGLLGGGGLSGSQALPAGAL